MKQSIRPFENIFSVISLLLFSQGFYSIILGSIGGEEGDVDSPLLRVAFLLIYFITCALLAFRFQRTLFFLSTNRWILVLTGLTIASISWSSVPDIAFRKVISLLGTTLFSLYLASRYRFEEQLKIYAWTFGIAVFFSFIFIFAFPQYGISSLDAVSGAWRGIYPHKNGLGQSMFVSFLTFYFLSISSKKYRLLCQIGCLLSIVLVFFGQSATSLLSIIFIFIIAQGLKRLSLKTKKSVFFVLLFVISAVLLISLLMFYLSTFLSLNNKDITLTGRTVLWESLWEFIKQKPLFGYGYGTFFTSTHRETELLWKVHKWAPVHAHNGYIGLWLSLGLAGLTIFIMGYVGCLFDSLFKYLAYKDFKMLWIFLILLYSITLNLTEVSFWQSQSTIWIISLVAIYSIKTPEKNIKSFS